jgi:hypothetical protein
VYTSFLRQPTAKLDYVLFFPPRQFFFQLDPHLHFRIIQQQKKKRKKIYKAEKRRFFPFTTTTIFIWPRPYFTCSFPCTVLGFAFLPTTLLVDKETEYFVG